MSEKKNYHHIVNNLNNFCFQKKSNIHLTFHLHRISLFLKFHDETSSFFFPLPIFCYDRHTSYIPPPPPSRCLASDFGYYVAENRRCCKSDDVRNSRERGIDWNRGTHTHTHMYTHIYTHGERRVTGNRARCILIRIVQGNRQSVYEPLNFYPIMGLAATYVKQKFEFASLSRLPRLENVRLTNSFDESSIRAYA